MKKDSAQFFEYNRLVHSARVRFSASPGIRVYMGEMEKKRLHAFLIVWSHFSVKMTGPVEGWISRAGERAIELGFESIGKKLKHHANQEADHDVMLVEDLKVLLARWNETYPEKITMEALNSLRLPENTNAYVDIHEDTIASQHPYGQVAIEYEIERISVQYGPQMVENVINTLGEEFNAGIEFLSHHVLLDQGHTKFNKALIEECFASGGDVKVLAETGAQALRIYGDFLTECAVASQQLISKSESKSWNSPSMI